MSQRKSALGRGLDAMISMPEIRTDGSSAISEIRVADISPNPEQPRTIFDPEALEELATSIRELGIIQPLSLRLLNDGSYQIIAGERRWRAAKMSGLDTVPAYVRKASDAEITEMALIENIQREDLNAIEVALALRKLIDTYSLTQERLAERLGKKRATIANHLRLLRLPAEIQLGLRDKLIDMGAQIILCDPHRAVVIGHNHGFKLRGARLTSPDIRAGIALLIAAMSAEGTSTISNIEQIDRGYQNIEGRLNAIGARITRI